VIPAGENAFSINGVLILEAIVSGVERRAEPALSHCLATDGGSPPSKGKGGSVDAGGLLQREGAANFFVAWSIIAGNR
jgi:hypothetical protein